MIKEFYHTWDSGPLSRRFEMLAFGYAGQPLILFPTSNGRYYEYKDFGMIESARELLEKGIVKIYCPDGVDEESWYNYDAAPAYRVEMHMKYERAIVEEVIPFIFKDTGKRKVIVGGASFGGYHSMNLAMRHPEIVSKVISMGGTFDIRPHIMGHADEASYLNNPVEYLPHLTNPWYLTHIRKIDITLGTGEWDICLQENREFAKILAAKKIPHFLDEQRGSWHDWPCWNKVFPDYILHTNKNSRVSGHPPRRHSLKK